MTDPSTDSLHRLGGTDSYERTNELTKRVITLRGSLSEADAHERKASCSCNVIDIEGPAVDCDVHGQPSAAFEAGRRVGAQEERDQQRIRGDLCRWCHRQPQPQLGERHAIPQPLWNGDVGELVCLNETGRQLAHGYSDQPEPF